MIETADAIARRTAGRIAVQKAGRKMVKLQIIPPHNTAGQTAASQKICLSH
jgi:hypothetical protein